MKRFLAVLALASVLMLLPLAAMAMDPLGDAEFVARSETEGIALDGFPVQQDADGQDQQDTMGDPDELGGGFRNQVLPPTATGVVPYGPMPVIDPLFLLLIQLI